MFKYIGLFLVILIYYFNVADCYDNNQSYYDQDQEDVDTTTIPTTTTTKSHKNNNWDVLIFTQRWPVTGCIEWMSEDDNNECILPSPREIWTIHGIWPTKLNAKIGPFFCNKTAKFHIDELKPFIDQLQQFWMNIEKGTAKASLWKHEWLKHGTCAALIPEMATVHQYFGQGLSWLQQYSMSSILQQANINPDQDHITILELHQGIKNILKYNPSIHCIKDPIRKETYLSEIRICFNKSLDLVDCDGVSKQHLLQKISPTSDNIITNCNLHDTIMYPGIVPPQIYNNNNVRDHHQRSYWNFPFVNFYKLIQFITWFTL